MKLKLKRPLIFFDLETTGTNITHDRIVEISILKVYPEEEGKEPLEKTRRINPQMHIPAGATAVHHITDEMVAGEPTFAQIAKDLYHIFEGADIAGFNSNRFDVPMLIEEFGRAGIAFNDSEHRFIDVQNIFHKKEPRTLVAAYRFYCDKDLENAHSANADTMATYEVLLGQLEKYPELGETVEELADFSNTDRALDLPARIVLGKDDEPVFNFGKHKGEKVRDVWMRDRSFFNWIYQGDFSANTKNVLRRLEAQYRMGK